jgi:hypothetical protein
MTCGGDFSVSQYFVLWIRHWLWRSWRMLIRFYRRRLRNILAPEQYGCLRYFLQQDAYDIFDKTMPQNKYKYVIYLRVRLLTCSWVPPFQISPETQIFLTFFLPESSQQLQEDCGIHTSIAPTQCPGQDSNRGPPEHKSRALTLPQSARFKYSRPYSVLYRVSYG